MWIFVFDKKANSIVKKQARDVSFNDYLLTPCVPFNNQDTIGNSKAWLLGLCISKMASISSVYDIPAISSILTKKNKTTLTHSQFRNYIVGQTSKKKFTKNIFNLSEKEILNVLAGYFDCDGFYDFK
jgi:hypothetical protein